MPIYVYYCEHCNSKFEIISPMPGYQAHRCPLCGKGAERRIAPVNSTFGFRLSDESHLKGHKDEFVRDV